MQQVGEAEEHSSANSPGQWLETVSAAKWINGHAGKTTILCMFLCLYRVFLCSLVFHVSASGTHMRVGSVSVIRLHQTCHRVL